MMNTVKKLKTRIQRAGPEHLDAILRIARTCQDVQWRDESFEQDLTEHERSQYWIGSVIDGQWAGFISCHVVLDQAEIMNLGVLPGLRRLGLGGHLLRSLLNSLAEQGVREVFLEVRQSNAAARHLYERTGFSVIGLRKNYYRDTSENAIIMSQNIGHNDK